MDLYTGTPAEIFARKYRQALADEPGARFVYSDVGYEVLGGSCGRWPARRWTATRRARSSRRSA